MADREYFMFDPLAEHLKPPLQGFRLVGEEYIAIDQTGDGALISQELGLQLSTNHSYLRLIDIATGLPLLRPAEIDAARRAAEDEARAEGDARRAAEEEIARLRAELARLRGEQ